MIHARADYDRFQDLGPACGRLSLRGPFHIEKGSQICDADGRILCAVRLLSDAEPLLDILNSLRPIAEGSTPIGEDEPVMLFRAQDKHFTGVLEDYRVRLARDPEVSLGMPSLVRSHIGLAEIWQLGNGVKAPDVPAVKVGG